jgi:chorismate synthase
MCSSGASARETAARVAAGAVVKKLLSELGVSILSHVIQLGSVRSKAIERPTQADLGRVDESPVRCFDAAAEAAMIDEVKAAAKDGDSLAASSKCSDTGYRSVSAVMCTGIARSTPRWPRRS